MNVYEEAQTKIARIGDHSCHLKTLQLIANNAFDLLQPYGDKRLAICSELLYDLFQLFLQKSSTKQFKDQFLGEKFDDVFENIRILNLYSESHDLDRDADDLRKYIFENFPSSLLSEYNFETSTDLRTFASQYIQLARFAIVILVYDPPALKFVSFYDLLDLLSNLGGDNFKKIMVEYVFFDQLSFAFTRQIAYHEENSTEFFVTFSGIFTLEPLICSSRSAISEGHAVIEYLENPFINLSNYKKRIIGKCENIMTKSVIDGVERELQLIQKVEVTINALDEFVMFLAENIAKTVLFGKDDNVNERDTDSNTSPGGSQRFDALHVELTNAYQDFEFQECHDDENWEPSQRPNFRIDSVLVDQLETLCNDSSILVNNVVFVIKLVALAFMSTESEYGYSMAFAKDCSMNPKELYTWVMDQIDLEKVFWFKENRENDFLESLSFEQKFSLAFDDDTELLKKYQIIHKKTVEDADEMVLNDLKRIAKLRKYHKRMPHN